MITPKEIHWLAGLLEIGIAIIVIGAVMMIVGVIGMIVRGI